MEEHQRILIDKLNAMYQSQSLEYRQQYRDEYFSILEYLVQRPGVYQITCDDGLSELQRLNMASLIPGKNNL